MSEFKPAKIALILAFIACFSFVSSAQAGWFNDIFPSYPLLGNGTGTINQLSQWKNDGTNITQNVADTPVKITGLESENCIGTDANGVLEAGTCTGSGSSAALDLGDDGSNESAGIAEIATTGDTNSIFSEPTANKLLIDLSNNWPESDTALALSANGSNCSAGSAPLGVDASGAVESCFDVWTEAENTAAGYLTGNETVTLSGDISGSGATAITTTIGADKVLESHLKAVDAASDEECLTYETTTGDFEWQACGAGGATAFDDIGDPDAATTIAFDDTEIVEFDTASDGEVFFTIDGTDIDLATDTTFLKITTVDNDDANYIPFIIQDDSGGTPDNLVKITGTEFITSQRTSIGTTDADAKLEVLDATGAQLRLTHTKSSAYANFTTDTNGDLTVFTAGEDTFFNSDVILDTGHNLGIGAVQWNSGDSIDGEQIATDSIDDDSIDFTDVTAVDLTFAEGDITDATILEADLKAVDVAGDEECLTYESTGGDFEWQSCGSGGGDSISIDSVAVTDPDFVSTGDIDFVDTTNTITANINADTIVAADFADADWGDASISTNVLSIDADVIDFDNILQSNTLAGNPALAVDECYFATTTSGGGFICEGSTADTSEQLYLFPDVNGSDTTVYIASDATQITDLDGDGLAVSGGALIFDCSDVASTGITCSGEDITVTLGTAITSSEITDNEILEADLKAVDTASDEECLTFESTGGDFEWQSCGTGTPGGSDTQIQFNDSSAFGGDSGLTYNKTTNELTVGDGTAGDSVLELAISGTVQWVLGVDDSASDAFVISDGTALGTANALSIANDGTQDITAGGGLVVTDDITLGGDTISDFVGTGLSLSTGTLTVDLGTAITSSEITDNEIVNADINSAAAIAYSKLSLSNSLLEADLKAVDAAGDEECLTYESTGGDFEWQSCGSGGGDSISIDSVAVTDPDFVSTGDIDFVDTTNTITANYNADSLLVADVADGDWGDFSVATNVATLDADVVGTAEIADADFGDWTCSGGVCTLDSGVVDSDAISDDSVTHADIADADQMDTKCLWFEDPTDADDFKSVWANKTGNDFLITEIWAESDQTVNFDLQIDDGTPADVNGTDISPAAGEAEDTTLSGDTTLAAGEELDLAITSVSGTPTWLSICWTGNWVD